MGFSFLYKCLFKCLTPPTNISPPNLIEYFFQVKGLFDSISQASSWVNVLLFKNPNLFPIILMV